MKDLKLDSLIASAKDAGKKAGTYAGFIFIITVLGVYGFLVLQISTLSQAEPSDDQVTEQLSTVKRLKLDQNAIDKIEQLEDQNVGVQSLFKEARNNPFQD